VLLDDCPDRVFNDFLVVGNHVVKNHSLFSLDPFFDPMPAFVVGQPAGAGHSQNGDS
jgi:hypothetical protein